MMGHKGTLRATEMYDMIWAFKYRFELANREVMRAIIECFWPVTNNFVTPKGELRFSVKEIKEVTGLLIFGEIYEEYLPIESELEAESEEFRALFFQLWPF